MGHKATIEEYKKELKEEVDGRLELVFRKK